MFFYLGDPVPTKYYVRVSLGRLAGKTPTDDAHHGDNHRRSHSELNGHHHQNQSAIWHDHAGFLPINWRQKQIQSATITAITRWQRVDKGLRMR